MLLLVPQTSPQRFLLRLSPNVVVEPGWPPDLPKVPLPDSASSCTVWSIAIPQGPEHALWFAVAAPDIDPVITAVRQAIRDLQCQADRRDAASHPLLEELEEAASMAPGDEEATLEAGAEAEAEEEGLLPSGSSFSVRVDLRAISLSLAPSEVCCCDGVHVLGCPPPPPPPNGQPPPPPPPARATPLSQQQSVLFLQLLEPCPTWPFMNPPPLSE